MTPAEIKNKVNNFRLAEELHLQRYRSNILCPFHDDHHPSMHVYAGGFKCYACQTYTDAFGLVRQVLHTDFPGAKHWLLQHMGSISRQQDDEFSTYGRLTLPASAFSGSRPQTAGFKPQNVNVAHLQHMLQRHPLTDEARRFLFHERMLDPQTVEQAGLRALSSPQPASPDGRQGSFPAHSLLIPYRDRQGRLLVVQSRYMGPCEGEPRFRFPRQCGTPPLYGQEQLPLLKPGEKLIVTEGTSDCLTARSLGFRAVALPSSTLIDPEAVGLLQGLNLHMWPDNDEAGHKCYFRLHALLPQLVYHQLPTRFNDLSDFYVHLRHQGLSTEEARKEMETAQSE